MQALPADCRRPFSMPTELQINSLADIDSAIDELLDHPDAGLVPVIDPDLILVIKLKGRSWDGLVDVRVARYVLELQAAIDRARREASPDQTDRPLIKVQVRDGSTDLAARALELFNNLVGTMTDTQKFVIALSVIGVVFGHYSLKAILAHFDTRQRRQLDSTQGTHTVDELNKTLRFAIEKIDAEKPVRTLIHGMQSADTITLPAQPAPLTKEEAKERYPRKPRVTPIDVVIDAEYHVESVALQQPVKLSLQIGDHEFRATLSPLLNTDDQAAFLAKVKTALETATSVRVPLQINAKVNDDGVIAAVIVGIGKVARTESKPLGEYLE